MSTEADFTPPNVPAQGAPDSGETTFPLSTNLNIVFSAYEDRLVLRSQRVSRDPVSVLLTRRMTIIVLAQLLSNLPELSGLDKTPAQYWKEVLQMAHQNALSRRQGGKPESESTATAAQADVAVESGETPPAEPVEDGAAKAEGKPQRKIYLATSLTMQRKEEQLILALTGLPMPCAMTEPCAREPLFAIPLQVENVHQLIQLLIDKAQEADWHLPVNLPWLESPTEEPATTLGLLH